MAEHDDRPQTNPPSTSDGTATRSAVGQRLFDGAGNELGVLVEFPVGSGRLYLQSTARQNPLDLAAGGSPPPLVRFQAGTYLLGNNVALNIDASGNFIEPRDLPLGSTGGGGAANFQNSITFLREQERLLRQRGEIDAARSLANSLVILEAQHKNALELGDINATRNLADQLTIIAEEHRNALKREDINATRDLESQLTVLAETFRLRGTELEQTQEFTAEENRLSRENQVRLQRLAELSGLQRQVLSDKARGRELLAQTLGVDPIRSSALAQGLVPRGGTPADLFRGELQRTVDQPLVQPTSFDIGDIESAITQSQEGLGLPTQPTIGFARGGVIDMKKQGDGKFRVLVGEKGPELLEGDANTIQITPIRSAAHGATIQRKPNRATFTESPFISFSDFAGDFTFGRQPTSGGDVFTPPRPGPTISPPIDGGGPVAPIDLLPPPVFDPVPPIVTQPGGPSPFPRPVPTAPPTVTGGDLFAPPVDFPDFPPAPVGLTQGIESIFAHLGFDQVPTFTTGPQGGMQIPRSGLSAFDRLGISPSLLRVLQGGGAAQNFFVTPSGELQSLGLSNAGQQFPGTAGGAHAAPFLPSPEFRPSELLANSGFRTEDFLTIAPGDLFNAGFGTGANAPAFTEPPLTTGSPFPLPRLPLSIGPDVTGGSGFFLPDPRTIASFFRRLDPATQNLLLNFYSGAGLGGESVQRTFDFFTPSGTFNPSQVAGFG